MLSWSFDAEFFGLTVDAFTSGALCIDGMVERVGAIHEEASTASGFIIDILLAAWTFLELFMLASLAGGFWEEERATVALSTIARFDEHNGRLGACAVR